MCDIRLFSISFMFKRIRIDTKKILKRKNKKVSAIKNQRTLLATICRLMEDESLIVCVSRLIDSAENEKILPFGFKIKTKLIPCGVKFNRIHTNNLVHVGVDGVKPIEAMIVVTAGKFIYLF